MRRQSHEQAAGAGTDGDVKWASKKTEEQELTVEWRGAAALVVPEQQLDDLPVDGGVVHHQHPHRRRRVPFSSRSHPCSWGAHSMGAGRFFLLLSCCSIVARRS